MVKNGIIIEGYHQLRVSRMKTKKRIYLTAIIVFVLASILAYSRELVSANEIATDGTFTIDEFPENEVFSLDGEWSFYWQELYTPQDFKENEVKAPKSTVTVPNPWSSYIIEGNKLPKTGYATYRLIIDVPKSEIGTVKSLYIPGVSSAYTLWIDGENRVSVGKVGKNSSTMKPGNIPKTVSFVVKSNQVEIIFHVSNYFQRKAGLFESILIGESEAIHHYQEKNLFFRSMVIVSLLLMGLYHLTLFAFRKKELQFVFFGVLCIIVGIRAILVNRGLAPYILPNRGLAPYDFPIISWEMANKIEYLGATLGILFFSLFTYTQFKEDMSRAVRNLIIVVFSIYSLFIIIAPSLLFTRVMLLLQLLIMLTFMYLFFVYITALIRKRLFALLNSVAVGILILTAVNDILLFNNIIQTTELSSVGLLFFMFIQAIIIAKKYSLSFLNAEKLSYELFLLNASLEQQIQERTVELKLTNNELQVANQKLNDAHRSRSKWIHNITHEIAAPLTSIRSYTKGMLDGVIKSDQNYLQVVYDQSLYLSRLLEDLRDMTEIENNQIQFYLEPVNIQNYTHQLYEKYKLDIEKQGISFMYQDLLPQREKGYIVQIDKMRIEQVLVNLLKNAQRFVDDKGKIMMELGKEGEQTIIIKIIDNGAGIEEDELNVVFNRFYKGNKQGKPHNGSGLGLPISKEIIDYHQGELKVTSNVGEGSCFYFTLPLI